MRRKKKNYHYIVLDIDAMSKEDLWDYRPNKVVLILEDEDIEKINNYTIMTRDKKEHSNSEGTSISIKYPVTAEMVSFQSPDEDMEDPGCIFNPVGEHLIISGSWIYFKMYSDGDCWDLVEAELDMSKLKPVKEWEPSVQKINLENKN